MRRDSRPEDELVGADEARSVVHRRRASIPTISRVRQEDLRLVVEPELLFLERPPQADSSVARSWTAAVSSGVQNWKLFRPISLAR